MRTYLNFSLALLVALTAGEVQAGRSSITRPRSSVAPTVVVAARPDRATSRAPSRATTAESDNQEDIVAPRRTASTKGDSRSDSELMLEALKEARGESPNSARIERVAAQVRYESKRKHTAEAQALRTWKDPFAEDTERTVAVAPSGRKQRSRFDGQRQLQRELARARAETAVAQAEAATARAEAAKARATSARTEAAAARVEAVAARREAEAAREACIDAGTSQSKISSRARRAEAKDGRDKDGIDSISLARVPRSTPSKARRWGARGTVAGVRPARAQSPVQAAPEAAAPPAPPPPPPPAAFTSNSGILIVPITH